MTHQPTDSTQLLAAAISAADANQLRQILRNHPELAPKLNDPLPDGSFGGTALLAAVGRGSRPMIDALLDAGADPNARSHWWAGSFGVLDSCSPELAEYLIQRGAKIDAHAAARLGKLDNLKELIALNPTLVHARGGDGQTPLHFASTVQIAEFLLDHGAEIDALDVDHESTPAQYALGDRHDIVRYLISRGCKTDILMASAVGDLPLVKQHLESNPAAIRTAVSQHDFPMRDPRAGGTIYIWALGAHQMAHQVSLHFKHREVREFLIARSPAELRLVAACEAEDEPAIHALLAANPNLSEKLTEADGARLAFAAQWNNPNIVRLMLSAGFPVTARGQHRGTPLHWAAWHGNADIVRQLLLRNPPLEDTENDYGGTPLQWALHGSLNSWQRKTGDHPAVVEALLAAGATPLDPTADIQASPLVLEMLFSKRSAPKA